MPEQTRRRFIKVMGASTFAFGYSFLSCQKKSIDKPNIIYILADDLGYGDLGCYGQQQIQTPNLDRIAAEGLRFTDHYAGSTVCAPSRCSLMTGFHSGHSLIRGNATVPLRPQDTTLAAILKSAGYRTACIGKWGLGEAESSGIPNQQGFDYFYGYLNQIKAHNYYPEFLWRNTDKIYLNNTVVVAERGYAEGIGGASSERNDYSHDRFTGEALKFIASQSESPFFLYLAFTIPHANNEHWILDRHGLEVPDYGIYEDKDWPEAQKGHAAMISRMDNDIGALMAKLKELGLDENTVVFFSSDNGPHREGGNDPEFNDSNGPLRGIKRDLYEGGIRVPFIARWPNVISHGVSNHISAFWDMVPTVAELAGADIPDDIDGLSLVPELLERSYEQKKHDYLYWEFHEGQASHQAIRKGNWKGIRHDPRGALELYDLETDPGETTDLAESQSQIVKELEALLSQARSPSKVWDLKSAL